MRATLRLGTRASPLALAQSRLVAAALAERWPGSTAALAPIETRGDRQLAVPLAAVRDPEFFAAEIRAALRAGRIDFAVHSLKDLEPQPPPDLVHAGLPPRALPHDVVLFRGDIGARLAAGQAIRIGSSSSRRQANVARFLQSALPAGGGPLHFRDLRGGVDRRLHRIRLPAKHPEALDGVVLALAGLQRLWSDPAARPLIAPVLAAARWMVLPLSHCPAAAGQGVLVLECRADDLATRALLAGLHDPRSAAEVAAERAALAQWPAGQHGGLGATALHHAQLGLLCHLRGAPPDRADAAAPCARLHWQGPAGPLGPVRPWDGASWRALSRRERLAVPLRGAGALFVAHWQAAEHLALPPDARLWVSGVASWQRLAARGHWVEGCADHLGFAHLSPLLQTPVLGLPPPDRWTVLTHADAVDSWKGSGVGEVLASYRVSSPDDPAMRDRLRAEARSATHFYWHSSAPLALLHDALPPGAVHAAGPGKTLHHLEQAGLGPVLAFPDHRSWQAWLGSA